MTDASGYSFLRRRIWLAGAALAVGMAVLFVALGVWQLRRHDERRELDAVVTARLSAPAVDFASLDIADPDGVRYRQVVVTGRYEPAEQVLVRNQSFRGSSGYHVVVPLLRDGGTAVLVDRGFVTLADGDGGSYLAPVQGMVTVTGILLPAETRGSFGPRDPAEGRLDTVSRVDIARLQQQMATPLAAMYVLLQEQIPTLRAGDPFVADAPDPGRGRHLGYALQWFLFAAIAVVGFVLLVRRTATPAAGGAPDRPPPRLRSR